MSKYKDLNVFSVEVLEAALFETRKDGAYKMKQLSGVAILKFMEFDVQNDWMESKDYTKLGKMLCSAVITGCKLIGEPLEKVNLWNSIISLREDRQSWNKPTAKDIDKIKYMSPIVTKFEAMSKRLTRNGKFPKTEEERRRRAAIKGALNPKLATALIGIKEEWYAIIYKNELESMKSAAERVTSHLATWNASGVPNSERMWAMNLVRRGVLINRKNEFTKKLVLAVAMPSEMAKMAKRMAEDESESFFFKMADKLGGLITGKREFISATTAKANSNTPFSSFIHFEFGNDTRFSIENKIIINRSPLDNEFYQYPTTFYNLVLDGQKIKFISELVVKEAFKS